MVSFRFSIFNSVHSMITVNSGTGAHKHGSTGELLNQVKDFIKDEFDISGHVSNSAIYILLTPENIEKLSELTTIFSLYNGRYEFIMNDTEFAMEARRF